MNEQQQVKSMEFCQAIIARMASNSFQLKAWFLVTFSALFTFFVNSFYSSSVAYKIIITDLIWMLPLLMFPYLDSYYLKQERIFRRVFEDFARSSGRKEFDLKPTKSQRDEDSILSIVFSGSVKWFYLPLLTAFQGLIIYHSEENSRGILFSIIFPAIVLIGGLIFGKNPPTARD